MTASLLILGGCKKTYEVEKNGGHNGDLKNYSSDVKISVQEVFAQLPQTIMYNLKDEANFRFGEAEWIYKDEYLVVRIPVSEGDFSYIYAVKPYNNPDGAVHLYGLQFLWDEGAESEQFTGRQMWINFQDWHAYGVRFDEGEITSYMTPIKLYSEGWESCGMENKRFYIDENDKIAVTNLESVTNGGFAPLDEGIGQPGCNNGGGDSFWDSLGDFFGGIAGAIGDLFNGIGDFLNGLGNGGSWQSGSPGNGYGSGGSSGGGYGGGGGGYGGGGGGGGGTPPPPPPPLPPVGIPYLPQLGGPGSEWAVVEEDPDQAPPNDGIPVAEGEEIEFVDGYDEEGYYYSRKTLLDVFIQANPYGMLDANEVDQLPMLMFQEIASYPVPQTVLDRIQSIVNANAPAYTSNNTYVQDINEGVGVVNMDFFPVHIQQLPKKANGQTMTPLEFLEFFRKNITPLFSNGNSTTFSPYVYNTPLKLDSKLRWKKHLNVH